MREAWVSDCWREKRRLNERLYYALPKHYLDDDIDDEDDEEEDDEGEEEERDEEEGNHEASRDGDKHVGKHATSTTKPSSELRELPSIFEGLTFRFYGYDKKNNHFPNCDKVPTPIYFTIQSEERVTASK